ncbi:MAG: hypothetical protein IKS49_04495 [Actinomycetaceae bacterium]|nr:hypothetical protein [Actinomycetaceae bacterium]
MGWISLCLVVFGLLWLMYGAVFIFEIVGVWRKDKDASLPRMVMYGQYTLIFNTLFITTYLIYKHAHGGALVWTWIIAALSWIFVFIVTWIRTRLPKDFNRLPIWFIKKQREEDCK